MKSRLAVVNAAVFLGIILASGRLSAQLPFLEESKGFTLESALLAEIVMEGDSARASFHPAFAFYFEPVSPKGRPAREAAFLDHQGSASFVANIYSEGAERNPQAGSGALYNTAIGFDARIDWVWDVLPISLSLPLSDTRIRWRYSEDDTAAVLSCHTLAIEPGYFILPNTRLSAGIGYMIPDLFYKPVAGTLDYRYLAWDIFMLEARVKSVLELPGGAWLSGEASVTRISDSEENAVWGPSIKLAYYPIPSIGIRFDFSSSKYVEGGTYSNPLFRVMGVTEAGGGLTVELLPWMGLEAGLSRLTPEDGDYEPVWEARALALVRI